MLVLTGLPALGMYLEEPWQRLALFRSGGASTDGTQLLLRQHTAVSTGDALLIFGGNNLDKSMSAEAWLFHLGGGGSWTQLTAAGAGDSPTGRSAHGAVWTGRRMLAFGGTCGGRFGHAAAWVADYGVLAVFGGRMAGTQHLSNELWAYKPDTLLPGELRFEPPFNVSNEVGGELDVRVAHNHWDADGVFDGLDGAGGGTWHELLISSGSPCPRYGHMFEWHDGSLFLLGGYDASHQPLSDLWRIVLPNPNNLARAQALTGIGDMHSVLTSSLFTTPLRWVGPVPFAADGPYEGAATMVNSSFALIVAEVGQPINNSATDCIDVQCLWSVDPNASLAVTSEARTDEVCTVAELYDESPQVTWGYWLGGCSLPWITGTLCRGSDPNAAWSELQPPSVYLEATATWVDGQVVLFGGARYNESTGDREYATTMWKYSPDASFAYQDEVDSYRREAVRNMSAALVVVASDVEFVISGGWVYAILVLGFLACCCGIPCTCCYIRRRGLAKQRLLQEELNLSRQDAVMVKANEAKRRNRFQALEDNSLAEKPSQQSHELSVDF